MNIEPAVKYAEKNLDTARIDLAIVLGSGLTFIEDGMENLKKVKTSEIPGFPVSTVAGHKGTISTGLFREKKIMILAGRVHFYEGYSYDEVVFPVEILKGLGVKKLLMTNAAGGINAEFETGSIVVLENYIAPFAPLFKDPIKNPYSAGLNSLIYNAAVRIGLNVYSGCYAYMTGPSFETKAEINYLRLLGGDVVGMSTVPETVHAVKCGIEVAAVSRVSNPAAGMTGKPLSHRDVLESSKRSQDIFAALLQGFIDLI